MRAEWSSLALADFADSQAYLTEESAQAATQVAERILAATKQLESHPNMGRSGQIKGTREWVIVRTPYILIYRVKGDVIEIIRMWHSKQNWFAPG